MDPQHVRIPMHENVSMGKQPTVNVLCLDVTRCSKTLQFLLCTLGVFVLYLLYGYLQVSKIFYILLHIHFIKIQLPSFPQRRREKIIIEGFVLITEPHFSLKVWNVELKNTYQKLIISTHCIKEQVSLLTKPYLSPLKSVRSCSMSFIPPATPQDFETRLTT